MTATKIDPLPTLELREVDKCLQDGFDALEYVAWTIKQNVADWNERDEMDPPVTYEYLRRVFACLDEVSVQIQQLRRERRELSRHASGLAMCLRLKPSDDDDAR